MPRKDVRVTYGPWAVIAGASEGIGAAFAHGAAARGLNTMLVARRPQALEQVAADIRSRTGVETRCLTADLTTASASAEIVAATTDLDVGLLVYCAGGDPDFTPFLDNTIEAAQQLLDRNCRAPMQLTHHFARAMVDRGRGGIMILSSGAAFAGTSNIAVYGATKAFDMIFAEALWSELRGDGVDVLGVVMGETDTPSLRRTRHARGLAGPDDPVGNAASVDEVVSAAFAHLGRGPTCFGDRRIRTGARLISPLPRGLLVRLMTKASRRTMG